MCGETWNTYPITKRMCSFKVGSWLTINFPNTFWLQKLNLLEMLLLYKKAMTRKYMNILIYFSQFHIYCILGRRYEMSILVSWRRKYPCLSNSVSQQSINQPQGTFVGRSTLYLHPSRHFHFCAQDVKCLLRIQRLIHSLNRSSIVHIRDPPNNNCTVLSL